MAGWENMFKNLIKDGAGKSGIFKILWGNSSGKPSSSRSSSSPARRGTPVSNGVSAPTPSDEIRSYQEKFSDELQAQRANIKNSAPSIDESTRNIQDIISQDTGYDVNNPYPEAPQLNLNEQEKAVMKEILALDLPDDPIQPQKEVNEAYTLNGLDEAGIDQDVSDLDNLLNPKQESVELDDLSYDMGELDIDAEQEFLDNMLDTPKNERREDTFEPSKFSKDERNVVEARFEEPHKIKTLMNSQEPFQEIVKAYAKIKEINAQSEKDYDAVQISKSTQTLLKEIYGKGLDGGSARAVEQKVLYKMMMDVPEAFGELKPEYEKVRNEEIEVNSEFTERAISEKPSQHVEPQPSTLVQENIQKPVVSEAQATETPKRQDFGEISEEFKMRTELNPFLDEEIAKAKEKFLQERNIPVLDDAVSVGVHAKYNDLGDINPEFEQENEGKQHDEMGDFSYLNPDLIQTEEIDLPEEGIIEKSDDEVSFKATSNSFGEPLENLNALLDAPIEDEHQPMSFNQLMEELKDGNVRDPDIVPEQDWDMGRGGR